VEGPAVGVSSPAVDGDDAGVLEPAGDFGFEEEPGLAVGVLGVAKLQFLEGDFALHLRVEGDEDLPEASSGVGAENAETRAGSARGGRLAGGSTDRPRAAAADEGLVPGRLR